MTFISQVFCVRIISEFLNSRGSTRTVNKTFSYSLLARTLHSRGSKFANTSENEVLTNISEFTVIWYTKVVTTMI